MFQNSAELKFLGNPHVNCWQGLRFRLGSLALIGTKDATGLERRFFPALVLKLAQRRWERNRVSLIVAEVQFREAAEEEIGEATGKRKSLSRSRLNDDEFKIEARMAAALNRLRAALRPPN